MSEVAKAYVSLIPSASGFAGKAEGQIKGPIGKTGSKLGGILSGALKKAAVGGAVAVGAAVGASVYGGFKAGIQQQNAQKILTGLYGSADKAKATLKSLGDVTKRSPIDADSYRKAAESLAYAGVQGKGAVTTLRNVGLAITSAGGDSSSLNSATGAILKMVNAGKVNLDGLQQLSNSGVPILSGLAKHFGTSVADVNKMASNGTIKLKDVLGVLKNATGKTFQSQKKAGEAAEKTFSASFASIKKQVTETIGKLVLPLIQKLTPVLGKIAAHVPGVINGIADGFKVAAKFISPVIGLVEDLFTSFSGSGASKARTAVSGLGDLFQAKLLPIVKTVGEIFQSAAGIATRALSGLVDLFTSRLLPAALAVGQYVTTNLVPIIARFAAIIKTKVVPVVSEMVSFFVGRLLPAVFNIYKAIALKLKPVFDALVSAVKQYVLPTLVKLLDKFHEYQPTIEKIILAVYKVVGAVLKFAAAILGKVLPPLIKFAGFLIKTVFTVLFKIVDAIAAVIRALVHFGEAIGTAVGKIVHLFSTTIPNAFRSAVTFVKTMPGRLAKAGAKLWDWIPGLFGGAMNKAQNLFTRGINWIISHIINPFIGFLNHIPGVDIGKVGKVGGNGGRGGSHARKLFNYARGGVLPGYTPGRDIYSMPMAHFSGGEGILVPEAVKGLGGAGAINSINRSFSARVGSQDGSGGNRFFLGGVLGDIGHGFSSAFGAAKGAIRGITSKVVLEALKVAEAPIRAVLHAQPNKFVSDLGNGVFDKINSAIRDFIAGHGGEDVAKGGFVSGIGSTGYAKIIVNEAKRLGLGYKGAEIGLMTGLVESNLRNYANSNIPASLKIPHDAVGSDHYSAGIMQQQTGPFGSYWGTLAQVMNPTYAADRFFAEMTRKVPGWFNLASGDVAQRVQVSGVPDAYYGRKGQADGLLSRLYDNGGVLPPGLTLAMNNTGRNEHVLTGGQMKGGEREVVKQLQASQAENTRLLKQLIAATTRVGGDVGSHLNGATNKSALKARTTPAGVH